MLQETNDLQQSPASLLSLHGSDTGRECVLSVVAQLRQMDSHNPLTGGECGLLECDTVDVKVPSYSLIQFPACSSPHTSHT